MTLNGSGQISFNDLRVELGVSSQAPFSITSAATGVYATINTNSPSKPDASTPHAISEWYSYNHNAAACAPLNSGASLSYATTTPADPTNCGGGGNEYTNSQVFYSNDCSTLGSGCTVYSTSACTTTAYNAGVRYINDGGTYYALNASSVVSATGGCNQ